MSLWYCVAPVKKVHRKKRLCACGCGTPIPSHNGIHFVHGHYRRYVLCLKSVSKLLGASDSVTAISSTKTEGSKC
jgi:hypothetical protein